MSQQYKIALDAMGGDFGPDVVVPAAALAYAQNNNLRFIFFGDQYRISPLVEKHKALAKVSEVHHTPDIISNDEKPAVALRQGRNSSMRLAINAVKDGGAHAVVSAGNTGALMAMAKFVLKCLPGIDRPAIASLFPARLNDTVMLDMGANISCDAEMLVQFALLGSVYARVVRGIERPTVGILNIGSEEMKGHDHLRDAASILTNVKFPGHFKGFVEGDDIPNGTVDVVVTDGFTGNVALKVAEGVANLLLDSFKGALKSSPLALLGGLLAYGALKRLKKSSDPRAYNGGMFLGLNGICVKSHGGMDAYGFSCAILVAANLVQQGYNERVAVELEKLLGQESFVSELSGAGS